MALISNPPTVSAVDSHVLHISEKTNWWFVSVTDSTGAVGWGEGSLNSWEPVLCALNEHLRSRWIGLSLRQAQEQISVHPASHEGLLGSAATSAFAQALLSLQAVHLGQPPHALLGLTRREQVRLYANINRATRERTPQGFVATARRALEQGFTALKAAPFDGLTPALCASAEGRARISQGIDCMMALREAAGPQVRLMVDCHWRFDEPRALQALSDLRAADLYWFECPLPETYAHWAALRRLRRAAQAQGVKLAAAETQIGLAAFQTLFEEALYDAVMPDVKYCGGPWEMLRIAQCAADHGVQFSPHNPTGPVCTWHSLQVALAAPECEMLEIQFEESDLTDQVSQGVDLAVRGGFLQAPRAGRSTQTLDRQVPPAHPYRAVPPGIESLLNR